MKKAFWKQHYLLLSKFQIFWSRPWTRWRGRGRTGKQTYSFGMIVLSNAQQNYSMYLDDDDDDEDDAG